MKRIWKNDRGKLEITMVKAQVCTNMNMNMNSFQFDHFIKDKKKLLEAVKSDKKFRTNKIPRTFNVNPIKSTIVIKLSDF